jgi:HD-like signal output (HDOD) protein
MSASVAEIIEKLETIEDLPTLPVVVQQLNKLIASRTSNMAQIAAVIACDQAIATRVIRLINSAFYGFSGRITSIQHAIVMLGLNMVKNIVTGVAIVRTFEHGDQPSIFDREKFWLHSFACAMGARTIADRLHKEAPEDFFLAGLLHDMGILVMDQFFHREFIETLQLCMTRRIAYTDAERAAFGITHCEIGEHLLRRWNVPDVLVYSARYHHEPVFTNSEIASCLDVIAAVHISDVTVNNLGMHMGLSSGRQEYCAAALKHLALSQHDVCDEFEIVKEQAANLIEEWGF